MSIPSNYEILFTHGGGHGQFAAVPLNLCPTGNEKATYIVNGTWSERAAVEAKKYCCPIVISSKNDDGTFTSTPNLDGTCNNDNDGDDDDDDDVVHIDPESRYVYLCSNETVNGIELHRLPKIKVKSTEGNNNTPPTPPPLVVDASSDFSTKPIDWIGCNVGILYACASKNIGHPGLTVCIIRRDLLHNPNPICPGVFNYTINSAAENLWNTAATFNIEVVGIVMDWIIARGGVEAMEELAVKKSSLLYDFIDSSGGFYSTPIKLEPAPLPLPTFTSGPPSPVSSVSPVSEFSDSEEQKQKQKGTSTSKVTSIRSRMNVPFDIMGGSDVSEEMTNKFIIEAWEKGIVGLRTLTPFGVGRYLRASLYHGVSLESTEFLLDFMKEFMEKHQHQHQYQHDTNTNTNTNTKSIRRSSSSTTSMTIISDSDSNSNSDSDM